MVDRTEQAKALQMRTLGTFIPNSSAEYVAWIPLLGGHSSPSTPAGSKVSMS